MGVIYELEFEATKPLKYLQTEEIQFLGQIILSLATHTTTTPNTDSDTLGHYDIFLAHNYSNQLHQLAVTLLTSSKNTTSVF